MGKFFALRDCLKLCRDRGLLSVLVMSDSLVAVSIVQGKFQIPWQYTYELNECIYMARGFVMCHVLREANGVADRLAAEAHIHHGQQVYSSVRDLTRDVLNALRFDESGC